MDTYGHDDICFGNLLRSAFQNVDDSEAPPVKDIDRVALALEWVAVYAEDGETCRCSRIRIDHTVLTSGHHRYILTDNGVELDRVSKSVRVYSHFVVIDGTMLGTKHGRLDLAVKALSDRRAWDHSHGLEIVQVSE